MCIGPVNKTINMLACWFEDPDGDAFKRRALHTLIASHRIVPVSFDACPPTHCDEFCSARDCVALLEGAVCSF